MLYPEGSPASLAAMVLEAGSDELVSSAVPAPLAVVQKTRAMAVPLTALGLRWMYNRAVTQLVIPGIFSKLWEVTCKT